MRSIQRTARLALLLALALAAQAAAAGESVTLKAEALVVEGMLRLRDVADISPGAPEELARLPLGNSPWPGQSRRVTRGLVTLRLLAAGLDPRDYDLRGAEACVVQRAATTIEADEIVSAARQYLLSQFPEGGHRVRVELLRPVGPLRIEAAREPIELRPAMVGSAAPTGTVRVDVDVVRDGVRLRKVSLSFAVKVDERVAVAARSIGAGERFTRANVTLAPRDVAAIAGGCVHSFEELAGKAAARPLRAGQPITRRLVAEPERPFVIGPNDRVFLVVETATLRAVMVGRSLGRAREGELARARNLTTGREVLGVAAANSTIRVMMEGQPHG